MQTDFSSSENDRSNLGVLLDPELKVKIPGGIPKSLLAKTKFSTNEENGLLLSVDEIKDIAVACKEHNSSVTNGKIYLHEILQSAQLVIPQLEIPERNPVLQRRIDALKKEQANKEYRRMTKNVDATRGSEYQYDDSIGAQLKMLDTGIIAVIQLVVSWAAAFAFGFIGIDALMGTTSELSFRLLAGIVCTLIVGFAELYFLVTGMHSMENLNESKKKS